MPSLYGRTKAPFVERGLQRTQPQGILPASWKMSVSESLRPIPRTEHLIKKPAGHIPSGYYGPMINVLISELAVQPEYSNNPHFTPP